MTRYCERLAKGLSEPLPFLIARPGTQRVNPSLIRLRRRKHLRVTIHLASRSKETPPPTAVRLSSIFFHESKDSPGEGSSLSKNPPGMLLLNDHNIILDHGSRTVGYLKALNVSGESPRPATLQSALSTNNRHKALDTHSWSFPQRPTSHNVARPGKEVGLQM